MEDVRRDHHRRYFEDLYGSHAEPWDYSARAAEVLRHEYLADEVRRLKPRRVLEIGCSLGLLTARLLRVDTQLLAIDLIPTAVEKTRARLQHEIVRVPATLPPLLAASALEPPFRDGSFDLILCTDGLRSWQLDAAQRAEALQQVHALLQPGGRAILTDHMRSYHFADFIGDVERSPLHIESIDYLGDRPWYQFETWFKAIRHTAFARALLRNLTVGRMLRAVGRRLSPAAGSRHICIVARREA